MDTPLDGLLAWTDILAIAGAIVGGYVVSWLLTEAYYPRTFGVLTANVILAGLAWFGAEGVADPDLLILFMMLSAPAVALIYIATHH